jgi:hypothetical protein
MTATTPAKHAGLLVPFEMFRISQLAAIFAELLVSKARNILDADLVLTRHPSAPILLLQIEGSVVGGDPPEFWRENADLVSLASRAFPRQVIMYYVEPPPERREGFMVAQQGQVLAADDATHDRMPPGATEADWPVARLCQQLRIPPNDLEARFPGGPSVRAKLVEPAQIDDQALLMTLAGRDAGAEGATTAPAPAAAGQSTPAASTAAASKRGSLEEDTKRREKERQAEEAEQARRNEQVRSGLRYTIDEMGLVAAPQAELSEPEILVTFVVPKVSGDLPEGLPRKLADELQGKRIDVAVKVDFLSEVFVENTPLSRAAFDERATDGTIGGRSVKVMEVLGPRLGYGTFVSTGKAPHVFVSRKIGSPLPEQLVSELLEGK